MLKVMLKTQQVSKFSSPHQDNGEINSSTIDDNNNGQNSKVGSNSGSSSSRGSSSSSNSSSGVHKLLAHSGSSDLIDQLPNTVSVCFYNIKSYELIALLSDKVRYDYIIISFQSSTKYIISS